MPQAAMPQTGMEAGTMPEDRKDGRRIMTTRDPKGTMVRKAKADKIGIGVKGGMAGMPEVQVKAKPKAKARRLEMKAGGAKPPTTIRESTKKAK